MAAKKSILTRDMEHCYICGMPNPQVHHIFYGTSNRKNSEKYKCIVPLCRAHHTDSPTGVHHNKTLDTQLKEFAQEEFEKLHGHEKFMEVFGKNYL